MAESPEAEQQVKLPSYRKDATFQPMTNLINQYYTGISQPMNDFTLKLARLEQERFRSSEQMDDHGDLSGDASKVDGSRAPAEGCFDYSLALSPGAIPQ